MPRGRPPTGERMVVLTVRVPGEVREFIERKANDIEASGGVSQIARQALLCGLSRLWWDYKIDSFIKPIADASPDNHPGA